MGQEVGGGGENVGRGTTESVGKRKRACKTLHHSDCMMPGAHHLMML